jgi:hypothetical protein
MSDFLTSILPENSDQRQKLILSLFEEAIQKQSPLNPFLMNSFVSIISTLNHHRLEIIFSLTFDQFERSHFSNTQLRNILLQFFDNANFHLSNDLFERIIKTILGKQNASSIDFLLIMLTKIDFLHNYLSQFINLLQICSSNQIISSKLIEIIIDELRTSFQQDLLDCLWLIYPNVNILDLSSFFLDFYFQSSDPNCFKDFTSRCLLQSPNQKLLELLLLMARTYQTWKYEPTLKRNLQFQDVGSEEVLNFDFPQSSTRVGLYLYVSNRLKNNLSIQSFQLLIKN